MCRVLAHHLPCTIFANSADQHAPLQDLVEYSVGKSEAQLLSFGVSVSADAVQAHIKEQKCTHITLLKACGNLDPEPAAYLPSGLVCLHFTHSAVTKVFDEPQLFSRKSQAADYSTIHLYMYCAISAGQPGTHGVSLTPV